MRLSSAPLVVASALLLTLAQYATARQTVAARPLFRGELELDTPWLALLREANTHGSEEGLVAVITEFLADLSGSSAFSAAASRMEESCCDPRRHVFQIAFLASEAADAPLVRIFVHRDGLSRRALPGIAGPGEPLYEIFVAEDQAVRLESVYHSEPTQDPLAAQTGDFVRLVLGKIALPLGADTITSRIATAMRMQPRGPHQAELRTRKPPLAVTVSRVVLPAKRAKVSIAHTLTVTDPAGHIAAQARWIADAALRRAVTATALGVDPLDDPVSGYGSAGPPAAHAACSAIARDIAAATARALEGSECSPLPADPGRCFKIVSQAIGVSYESAARERDECPSSEAYPLVRRFLSAVPARLTAGKGTVALTNAPLARWSFGLSTAYIAALDTDNARPRARISSGRIAVDPFSRVLAMGIVSFVPAGYDPGAIGLSMKERFRLFGGIAFAPHFGAAGGASWSLNRYLGVNAGYALLAYDTPRAGEVFDAPPSEANRADPFDVASTHALFVGLTYNIR